MNLEARLTAAFAALAVGVSPQTFNYWRRSGKLTPDANGHYRLGDALAVEARMRRSNKSHRGARADWAALDENSNGMAHAS